jgi:hypothetical protein
MTPRSSQARSSHGKHPYMEVAKLLNMLAVELPVLDVTRVALLKK